MEVRNQNLKTSRLRTFATGIPVKNSMRSLLFINVCCPNYTPSLLASEYNFLCLASHGSGKAHFGVTF